MRKEEKRASFKKRGRNYNDKLWRRRRDEKGEFIRKGKESGMKRNEEERRNNKVGKGMREERRIMNEREEGVKEEEEIMMKEKE
jgi:hypothetical protein